MDGLTIQNCVADTEDRRDILSGARDLLNNYTGTPYTLATAQAENGGVEDNPGWFDILSGAADDNLTDVELQAYLDGNPVSSAGHLVTGDDKSRDGGAVFCGNEAVGTIANCDFLNNHTPPDGDDGGAINIAGQSEVTINDCIFNGNYSENSDGGAIHIAGLSVVTCNDCTFDGNYAISPDGIQLEGKNGKGGHVRMSGNSDSPATPGTTFIANRCTFSGGRAENHGGVFQAWAMGSIVRFDACAFYDNSAGNVGNVVHLGHKGTGELTVTNCLIYDNKSTGSSNRLFHVRRNSSFVNCTFVGNEVAKNGMIRNHAESVDMDGDDVNDELNDTTNVVNCIFANNVVKNQVLRSRNNDFTIAATNCLFFGNTKTNGQPANNMQSGRPETGSISADPLLDANYVPGAGSPAIDAGVDVSAEGVTTDYNGNPRPQGAAYDIGAYEAP